MSDDVDHARRPDDLADHRRHLETSGAAGSPAHWLDEDPRGHVLTGALLRGATLLSTNFAGCSMEHADLSHTFAGGSCFDRARLTGANLAKATLAGASFDDATAANARFRKADLRGASLARAVLANAMLDGADATDACFAGALLRDASLATTLLADADLSSAELSGARFERTLVDDILLAGATGLEAARVVSIIVHAETLEGERARAWLLERASATASKGAR